MQYNTALSFLSFGIGLFAAARGRLRWTLACSVWPTAIGVLTVVEYLAGTNLGIDQLVFTHYMTVGVSHVGRMGLNTAVCCALSGCALLAVGQPVAFRLRPLFVGTCGLVTLGVAASVFFAYLTNIVMGSRWGITTPMAIHSALGLSLLGVGILVIAWRDHATNAQDLTRFLSGRTIPWAIFAVSLAVTMWAWYVSGQHSAERARIRFDEAIQQAHSAIINRMTDYEQVLISSRALFAASRSVERDEWHEYVWELELDQRYPGIQALGFARMVRHDEKQAYLDGIRREGLSDVHITPPDTRDVYAVVTFTETFSEPLQRTLGYDMLSEPVRRAAMEYARDTGKPTISGRLRPLFEPTNPEQTGFLLYLPVYGKGQSHATVLERRAALIGFTFGVFRVDDLMTGVLGHSARDIRFEIFDGTTTDDKSLLYGDESDGDRATYRPTFERVITSELGGRTWTFRFSTWPSFDAAVYDYAPVFALIGGLLGSVLLLSITWSLTTTRARAEALAERMTEALRKSEAQFRAVADHANDAIVSADDRGRIVAWNRSASNIFGYGENESLGQPLSILVAEHAWQAHDDALTRVASGEDHGSFGETLELVGRRKSGREFPLELSLSTWTEGGRRFYTGIMRDITERKRVQERLDYMATHDALTGLPNRTLFADRLEQALTRPAWNKRLVAVMFLDLDRFKAINDTMGHDAGDLLLTTVATRLKAAVRDGDTVARQGGDEFTIILIDMAQMDDVALVAQKILTAMTEPFDLHGAQVPVTFSIGIACYPVDGTDAATLLKHADTALYRAKARGRNTYQLYSVA
jgi:diguanylate cyclase (GGDEF)-like protein/PAS domain S-box-containing protein